MNYCQPGCVVPPGPTGMNFVSPFPAFPGFNLSKPSSSDSSMFMVLAILVLAGALGATWYFGLIPMSVVDVLGDWALGPERKRSTETTTSETSTTSKPA